MPRSSSPDTVQQPPSCGSGSVHGKPSSRAQPGSPQRGSKVGGQHVRQHPRQVDKRLQLLRPRCARWWPGVAQVGAQRKGVLHALNQPVHAQRAGAAQRQLKPCAAGSAGNAAKLRCGVVYRLAA